MKIKQGQCFFDVVLGSTGNKENLIKMALHNNVSITQKLDIGTEVIPAGKNNKRILEMFGKNNSPATLIKQKSSPLDFLFPNLFPISL